jgi:GMP synthase-like glutamine amidotransferase
VRVLVVANDGDADPGFVGARLDDHGATLHVISRENAADLAGADLGDLVVLLGSDWSVYDHAHAASVGAEQRLVHAAIDRGVPLLGICYGGQLVSSALGAAVSRSVAPEIGWYAVQSDDVAAIPSGPWFQFHFDAWSDDAAIRALARSPAGPQAYWYGRVLALQFHPEVTDEIIGRWLYEGAAALEAIGADRDRIEADTVTHLDAAHRACDDLVDAFLARADAATPGRLGGSSSR